MPDKPVPRRRWFQFRAATWYVLAAFVAGLTVGYMSLILGRHGPVWPTIFFCAPASLVGGLLSSMLNNDVPYIGFMVGGTAALYAMYARIVAILPKTRATLTIGIIHGIGAAVLTMFAG